MLTVLKKGGDNTSGAELFHRRKKDSANASGSTVREHHGLDQVSMSGIFDCIM